VLALAAKLASDFGVMKDGWNGFAVLQKAASQVGALDIGFAPGAGTLTVAQMTTFGTLDVLFSLGADEIAPADGTFVVYIGTHGDKGAHRADVILPGAAYTEKAGIYVNTEGRVQMANRAAFPPGEAREDWAIIRALSKQSAKAAVRFTGAVASGAVQGRSASDADRPDRGWRCGGREGACGPRRLGREGRLQEPDRGLLSDQPHRAGLRGDG
jgi:NADH dehydrogenase/NADH:ubiquinone oxidoreductase subunit G